MMSSEDKKSLCLETSISKFSYITHPRKQFFHLNWKIDHFNLMYNSIDTMMSPLFPPDDNSENQWALKISIDLEDEYVLGGPIVVIPKRFFVFDLMINKGNPFYIDYSLTLKSGNTNYNLKNVHEIVKDKKCLSDKIQVHHLFEGLKWSLSDHISRELTILCDICLINSVKDFQGEVHPLKYIEDLESLEHKISVLEIEEYNDFTFIVKNKQFPVVKVILALESQVFDAMFRTKMEENLTSTAEITDVEPEAFEKMLHFIYHKDLEEEKLKTSVFELMHLAHKYKLKKLEFSCTTFLYKGISNDNVVKVLKLSNLYEFSELRKKAMKFIKKNLDEIKDSEEFLNLIREYPNLLIDLVNTEVGTTFNEDNVVQDTACLFLNKTFSWIDHVPYD